MAVVVDDRARLDVRIGQPPESIEDDLQLGGVFTTAAWYYRLGRAVVGGSGAGALSGRLAAVDPAAIEVYGLVVLDRRWRADRYELWLRDPLIDQLLP